MQRQSRSVFTIFHNHQAGRARNEIALPIYPMLLGVGFEAATRIRYAIAEVVSHAEPRSHPEHMKPRPHQADALELSRQVCRVCRSPLYFGQRWPKLSDAAA